MINVASERTLSLTEAAKQLPRRRAGKPTHVATVYRWGSRGLRGVRLETIQIGGTRCTSVEALQRFFDRLSTDQLTEQSLTHEGRRQLVSQAAARLRERGV
ncbi:MAG: DUF1580 domain-containing protein [Planctomycetes bacterium]|nr:DUF1580 domain-containing protein [Planctomycetota bacterium]